MILHNTPGTRQALERALGNMAEGNEGAVMQLDLVDGDVLLCVIADQPLREEEAYAIRFNTTPRTIPERYVREERLPTIAEIPRARIF